MKKDITPYNENGNAHGYWERYWSGKPYYKGNYVNGNPQGYWKIYNSNGKLTYKQFYL